MFAYMTFSYPYYLKSDKVDPWIGNQTQYFNKERLSQYHTILIGGVGGLHILIFFFRNSLVRLWRRCYAQTAFSCGKCCSYLGVVEYDEIDYSSSGFLYSDDLLYEINFTQLYRYYKQTVEDKKRIK